MLSHLWHQKYGKSLAHILASFPLVWLVVNWVFLLNNMPNDLGFNPQEATNRFSGDWAMRLILITLAVSPLVHLSGSKVWITYRRMLGLWSFVYAAVHIVAYLGIDLLFDLQAFWEDIVKRTYITVGIAAFLMLVPLAWTSRASQVRALGSKAWKRLHKLVYLASPLIILHFFMMRKGFQLEPLVYGGILAVLMLFRVWNRTVKSRSRRHQRSG